jgi:hypothetical protein
MPGFAACLMRNLDRFVDEGVAAVLRENDLLAEHHAWDFCGAVWFADGRWHEVVRRYHQVVGSYCADTLPELMDLVSEAHGRQ